MRRRDFIKATAVSAVTWPLAARARQSATPTRRIGVLMETEEGNPERTKQFARFRDRLASLGWVEGHTVNIDYRFAAAHGDQFPTLAKELIALQPDVVLTVSTPATAAVQRESHTIPIVFLVTSDPIGSGFVSSLARPSGNLTGFMLYEDGIAGKWLGMLKQVAASLKRAALVANPKTTAYDYFVRTAEAAAPSFGIEVIPTPISNATDIERSIGSFAQVPNGGSSCHRMVRPLFIAILLSLSRTVTVSRPSTPCANSLLPAVSCPIARTSLSSSTRRRSMLTASCAEQNLPISQFKRRQSTRRRLI
jgi:putative tryptophan/tyrosine transport system substrate-binding protein